MILNPHLKLFYQGDRINNWLKYDKTVPVLVEIAPTAYCNANCPWCFFKDTRDNKKIDSKVMIDAIEDMADMGVKAINWTGGGEPTLHPDFYKFVELADKLGLEQGLFTNAYNEVKSDKFKWVRISMTDKGFKPINKPEGYFGINVNMTGKEPLERWCKKAREMGANYFQVRPALFGDYKKQPRMNVPIHLKKYETDNFKVLLTEYKFTEAVKKRKYNKCYGYQLCPSIDWNGMLSTCLYRTTEKDYILGDLSKYSFSQIWNFIPDHKEVTKDCQNCCKNHEINKVLYNLKKVEHKNFI